MYTNKCFICIFLEKENVEIFLANQTVEVQKHQTNIQNLELTLQHQRLIQSQKVIPRVYDPKPLQTGNPLLTPNSN